MFAGANSSSFFASFVRLFALFRRVNWFTVRCPYRYSMCMSCFHVMLGSGRVSSSLYVATSCRCLRACLWYSVVSSTTIALLLSAILMTMSLLLRRFVSVVFISSFV